MNSKSSGIIYLLIILFVIYSAIFAYNYTMNVDLMEARNFVTAREMIQHHDWLIPTMNGEPRIAKPPLPTWLTSMSMVYAGTDSNLMFNRIPAGISAVAALFFMFMFVRSYSGSNSTAFYSVLILSTSYMFIYMARKGSWDIFCHSFMLGAIWTIYEGLKSEKNINGWFISSGILMALSWMSKGPVSFYTILLPFIISYIVVYRAAGFRTHWKGLPLAFAIAVILSLLWPAYLYFIMPDFAASVASDEMTAWGNRHIKPFWYYLQFPIMSGVWLLPALALFYTPHSIKNFETKKEYFFLIIWILLEVILLAVVPEKKDRYLLPVAITMAIPIAYYVNNFSTDDSKWSKGLIKFYKYLSLTLITASTLAIAYMFISTGLNYYPAVILALSAASAFIIYKQKINVFIGLALALALFISGASPLAYSLNRPKSFMELLKVRQLDELKTTHIYSYSDNMKLVWAIDRHITKLDQTIAKNLGKDKYIFLAKEDNTLETIIDQRQFHIEPITTDLEHYKLYRFWRIESE